ncbi:MAG: glutathione transferase [Deltaproteobacteria bacterium]|nr:glutathione transferase [Deltaproteobacteria bacterium]
MQAHPLTLYVEGYFTNVWDASCFVALTEKGLEFATARALLRDGQGVPPALRDKAAIGRIPALQHGDLWLTESLAIIEYLDETFPEPRVLPADPMPRARMRQVMTWLRSDLWALRSERPWQVVVYPQTRIAPLSAAAAREAEELVALVEWLAAHGDLGEWNIAHADLAFALMRLSATGVALPAAAQALLDANLARPSVRAYVDRARPPNPPPQPRS